MSENVDQKPKAGKLFVICGPSGVGKKCIITELLKAEELNLSFSVSYTSRPKRQKEIDGLDYYFISKEEFKEKIQQGDLIEYAEFFDNLYGTPKGYLVDNLKRGRNVLLEIETIGFKLVYDQFPSLVSLFILPPSIDDLKQRLLKRNTEKEDQIKLRLDKAAKEIEESKCFKYRIVNDNLDLVIEKIKSLILLEINNH